MQVEGANGLKVIGNKVSAQGPFVLFHGALAAASATAVGHFPWFFTFNFLQERVPVPPDNQKLKKLGRNAAIGFCASVVSDTTSNSLRYTLLQTNRTYWVHQSKAGGLIRSKCL